MLRGALGAGAQQKAWQRALPAILRLSPSFEFHLVHVTYVCSVPLHKSCLSAQPSSGVLADSWCFEVWEALRCWRMKLLFHTILFSFFAVETSKQHKDKAF